MSAIVKLRQTKQRSVQGHKRNVNERIMVMVGKVG